MSCTPDLTRSSRWPSGPAVEVAYDQVATRRLPAEWMLGPTSQGQTSQADGGLDVGAALLERRDLVFDRRQTDGPVQACGIGQQRPELLGRARKVP